MFSEKTLIATIKTDEGIYKKCEKIRKTQRELSKHMHSRAQSAVSMLIARAYVIQR